MRKLIFVILALTTLGCSGEWHMKRAIAKDPSLLEKDTITFTDSVHVVTKEITHDSTFLVSKDTVTIVKDKLTIRHFYHNDSVWIYGECASDTIVEWRTVEVPVQTITIEEDWLDKVNRFALRYGLVLFLLAVLGFLALRIFRLYFSKR